MRKLIIVFALVLSVASCKNTPKKIVKDAAITHLKNSGVENIKISSVDSINTLSTVYFKNICKQKNDSLNKLTDMAKTATSFIEHNIWNQDITQKLKTICGAVSGKVLEDLKPLTISYDKLLAYKDTTV